MFASAVRDRASRQIVSANIVGGKHIRGCAADESSQHIPTRRQRNQFHHGGLPLVAARRLSWSRGPPGRGLVPSRISGGATGENSKDRVLSVKRGYVRHAFLRRPSSETDSGCCFTRQGWGPVSPYRDFDLTPCFEHGVVIPTCLLFLFVIGSAGTYYLSEVAARAQNDQSSRLLRGKRSLFFLWVKTVSELACLSTFKVVNRRVLGIAHSSYRNCYCVTCPCRHHKPSRNQRRQCIFGRIHCVSAHHSTYVNETQSPLHPTFVHNAPRLLSVLLRCSTSLTTDVVHTTAWKRWKARRGQNRTGRCAYFHLIHCLDA